ncbi:hypothetical protein [Acidicapsa ligni]|uniref:hypothetical protein n=1 Tax=Acidicapsa ligni TaxID=542300 RepID=UPI0021DF5430|nr:hypothetical protein [Acidicapsa ligni]
MSQDVSSKPAFCQQLGRCVSFYRWSRSEARDFLSRVAPPGSAQTFTIDAGAVIYFGGLIFGGIRMMSGRFHDAILAFFGALKGAGVLGWGAG